jgi:glycosyltransferase involved in cell wall biosynthesis
MEKVLTDHALRDTMKEKGLSHYKKFTWEKAAQEVLSVVEEVLDKK